MLAGYEVLLAADGEQGLLQAQTSVPDALVLDLGLPHIDGLDVCRQLRQTGNRTPILMLTARDGIEDRVAGLEAGGRRLSRQALRRSRAEGSAARDHAPPHRRL